MWLLACSRNHTIPITCAQLTQQNCSNNNNNNNNKVQRQRVPNDFKHRESSSVIFLAVSTIESRVGASCRLRLLISGEHGRASLRVHSVGLGCAVISCRSGCWENALLLDVWRHGVRHCRSCARIWWWRVVHVHRVSCKQAQHRAALAHETAANFARAHTHTHLHTWPRSRAKSYQHLLLRSPNSKVERPKTMIRSHGQYNVNTTVDDSICTGNSEELYKVKLIGHFGD